MRNEGSDERTTLPNRRDRYPEGNSDRGREDGYIRFLRPEEDERQGKGSHMQMQPFVLVRAAFGWHSRGLFVCDLLMLTVPTALSTSARIEEKKDCSAAICIEYYLTSHVNLNMCSSMLCLNLRLVVSLPVPFVASYTV